MEKGKLARHVATILPAMTVAEAISTTRIRCISSPRGGRAALVPMWFSYPVLAIPPQLARVMVSMLKPSEESVTEK